MEHFYDGQIRRYLNQFMRLMSNFTVKDGRGNLTRIPVRYGDMNRQVASVMKKNSENILNSAPFIACYIKGLDLARDRLQDPSFVSKMNIRERQWEYVDENPDSPTYGETIQDYGNTQGENYTVERLMPTPFNLQFTADIWTTNTDQKLQILEQILVLFRPALEIQTTSNYIDWTSLSYVELASINWSSRNIPQGTENDIDIANLSFTCPIWISTPAKVKKLGIITKIIANIFTEPEGTVGNGELIFGNPNSQVIVTPGNFSLLITDNIARLVKSTNIIKGDGFTEVITKAGVRASWQTLIDLYPGQFRTGLSYIEITKPDGEVVIGYLNLSPIDEDQMEFMNISFDGETLLNTDIADLDNTYTRGTVNAVIDPTTFNPGIPSVDTRYLILEDINTDTTIDEEDMPVAWKKFGAGDATTTRFVAHTNDIIQWDGVQWNVIFDSQTSTEVIYITNAYTGTQYKWDGTEWSKSVDGEYTPGQWRLVL